MFIQVIGINWVGEEVSYEYDVEFPSKVTHQVISEWLNNNAGDFKTILDFCAISEGMVVLDWMVPSNEERFFESWVI